MSGTAAARGSGLHEVLTTPPAGEPSIDRSPTTEGTKPDVDGETVGVGSGTTSR
jgi:hypothetical protein